MSSLSLKPPLYQPPAKKTAARTNTTKTTKMTRAAIRAQAGNWWTVFDRSRGGLAELAFVDEAVGSSRYCGVWAEPSLLDMLPSFLITGCGTAR
jgi:hypothetical protein